MKPGGPENLFHGRMEKTEKLSAGVVWTKNWKDVPR